LITAGEDKNAASPDESVIIAMNRGLEAETERLLSQRTRDIRFSPEMLRAYHEKTWPQRRKIARAWMVWVGLLAILFVPTNYLIAPNTFFYTCILSGLIVPLLHALNYWAWRNPRSSFVEGLSLLLLMMGMMVAYGTLAAVAGGGDYERILTGILFANAIAIVVFQVEFIWSLSLMVSCLTIFFGFELFNPAISVKESIGATAYYAAGIYAATIARKTQSILAQKTFLMSLRNQYRSEALKIANAQLEILATRDPLTGLANRRSAAALIDSLWNDRRIAKSAIAFVMADIDSFKRLNDSAGHAAGDECIQQVARTIEQTVRSGDDAVFRYGGEEFLIVLAKATPALAWDLAERIRCAVEALGIANPGLPKEHGGRGVVTISLGIAFADDDASPELVTKWADEALYHAKRSGRNATFVSTGLAADTPLAEPHHDSGDPPTRGVRRIA
jgi:diguanylate cyclase (GGDEF)-like protein